MFGIMNKGNSEIGKAQEYGQVRITGPNGGRYYYVWVPGHAVCKDTSVDHDGTSYSLECPFLKDDPGDGTRPCGLVDSREDNAFRVACEAEPPMNKTAEEVTEWFNNHPDCSYIYVEE
jgi:hypothetical protein